MAQMDSRTSTLILVGAIGLLCLTLIVLLRDRAQILATLEDIRELPERDPHPDA